MPTDAEARSEIWVHRPKSSGYGRVVPPTSRLLVASLVGLLACTDPDTEAPGTDTSPTDSPAGGALPSVMILTLDGVRAAELSSEEVSPLAGVPGEQCAPGLWRQLATGGRHLRRIHNIGETYTVGAHAVLLEGRFERISTVNVDTTGPANYRPLFPTLFEELRHQQAVDAEDTYLLANNQILPGLTASVGHEASGATWVHVPALSDTSVTEEILRVMGAHAPRLLVANLHDSDRAGHTGEGYLDRIRTQDVALTDLLARLEQEHPAWWANALIVITTDHGRHVSDAPESWREHGDSCSGCRELPLFLLGGAVTPGGEVDVDGPVADIDVTATVAAHLGIDVPWSQGISLPDLSPTGEARGPTGAVDVTLLEPSTIHRRFGAGFARRSEIVDGDQVLSSPTAWAAEAPVGASNATHDALCWRELDLAHPTRPALADLYAWTAHCRVRPHGGAWTDIGFAAPAVVAGFAPSLAWNGDRLDVAWFTSPIDASGTEPIALGMSFASWQADGTGRGRWTLPDPVAPDVTDGDISLVVARPRGSTTNETVIARAAALEPTAPAVSRGIQVINMAYRSTANLRFDDLWRTHPRIEHPALHAQGETTWLAVVGMDDGDRGIAVTQSNDAGRTWSPGVRVIGDPPLVHLAPRWSQGHLVYAGRAADGTASICRVEIGPAQCTSTGFERLDSFVPRRDGSVVVSVDTGVGHWEIRTLGP